LGFDGIGDAFGRNPPSGRLGGVLVDVPNRLPIFANDADGGFVCEQTVGAGNDGILDAIILAVSTLGVFLIIGTLAAVSVAIVEEIEIIVSVFLLSFVFFHVIEEKVFAFFIPFDWIISQNGINVPSRVLFHDFQKINRAFSEKASVFSKRENAFGE
jgi:hypothetical protein